MTQLNFVNIGAAKSGTTTLHDILIQHPELCIPAEKDFHYFDNEANYGKGSEWYEAYFDACKESSMRGEISATYLYSEAAAARLANDSGSDLKIIALLRNPAHRAYSEYLHLKRSNGALDLNGYFEKNRTLDAQMPNYNEIIDRGFYAYHLEKYISKFGLKQLKVVFLEELRDDPESVINEVLRFIGVDRMEGMDTSIRSNPKFSPKSKGFHRLFYSEKRNPARRFLKFIIPSFEKREAVRKYFKKFNEHKNKNEHLSPVLEKYLIEEVYLEDITQLENLLGHKIESWH